MIDPAALLVLAIILPAAGVVLALAAGGRAAEWVAMAVTPKPQNPKTPKPQNPKTPYPNNYSP